MKLHVLEREQFLPVSRQAAWDFFATPRNLDAITPPDIRFEILYQAGERMYEGQMMAYRMGIFPGVRVSWVTEIKAVEEGFSFVDDQRSGPYRLWHHRHTFEEVEGGVRMRDVVHYAMPFGWIGEIAHVLFVREKLRRVFDFRNETLVKRFGKFVSPA